MRTHSWRKLSSALVFSLVTCFAALAALAAGRHARSPEIQLDTLIPRDKWAGAGLDKLSAAEQQTLAEDITGLLASPPSSQNVTPPAKDRSQWRQLRRRMSQDEVKKLLGEPDRVSVSRFYDSWYYRSGSVTFNSKGHVDLWSEP